MNEPQATPVEVADYDAIAALMLHYRGGKRTHVEWLERFAFWWEENPCFAESMNRGWVLRHEGRLVGFIGRIPIPFWFEGREWISFSPVSWHVEPEFQGSGLTLFLNNTEESSDTVQWHTTGNERTRTIFIRLRYPSIPYPCSRRVTVFTNGVTALHERADRQGWPTRLCWSLYNLQQRWRGTGGIFQVDGMRVQRFRYADARFD
ncbi:MAG: GNAT family N-acetyltransferase, partial [Magnetococcales bacterium]|nr:GNAT family N-acetyltransferase [Magnetococcales bacterium]